jgi:hypothetical protein
MTRQSKAAAHLATMKRISGSRNFRSLRKKDFFDTIGMKSTCRDRLTMSALGAERTPRNYASDAVSRNWDLRHATARLPDAYGRDSGNMSADGTD